MILIVFWLLKVYTKIGMKKISESTKQVIKKLFISLIIIVCILLIGYLVFDLIGWTDLTREELQEFISSTGAIAPLVFIFVSFAQVTFVPIPGAVTILAGNYLFGFWLSFLYSYIGMMLGGSFAFVLGRWLGRPYINWVAGGKEKADEWIKKLKGRETVFLFFAFLLPLFPDDILCSIAGILPISFATFSIMQIITRATSIGGTLLFMSGEIIPYSGWGIPVLVVIAIIAIAAFIVSLRYADKLNDFFSKFIDKIVGKKNRTKNQEDEKNNS